MDLHGRNDRVVCLGCGRTKPRRPFQAELQATNTDWIERHVPRGGEGAQMFADGDADLTEVDFGAFHVPACDCCGGVLKPGASLRFGPAFFVVYLDRCVCVVNRRADAPNPTLPLSVPDVVFFGDVVPTPKVDEAFARVAEADAVLVAGTSLMVYSGWRFVLDASKHGTKIAVVNVGHTRAEKEGVEHLKLEASCGDVLMGACQLLKAGAPASSGP